ncbi:MAG: hypothetical protein NTV54_01490, partial [Ignavibacteriales bacterium]|nr:hypothetical protein [Ignavibacteriales bacterium]
MTNRKHFVSMMILLAVSLHATGFGEDMPGIRKTSLSKTSMAAVSTGKVGEAFLFDINNVKMPM